MIADVINKYVASNDLKVKNHIAHEVGMLAEWSFKRQFMETGESHGKLSLSAAGKCTRQLAYKWHSTEKGGKDIDVRGKITFWQGDQVELMLVKLAELAGCKIMATGLDQIQVSINVVQKTDNGDEIVVVNGHPDGILLADTTYLFECKSMSSFAFRRFEKGEIDHSYLVQMNMYMHALNLEKCVIVTMSKDTGVLGERTILKDNDIVKAGITNMVNVVNSVPEDLPDGWFNPDEKGFYPWQCLYCAYWMKCKPNAERVVVSRKYRLKEKEGSNESNG